LHGFVLGKGAVEDGNVICHPDEVRAHLSFPSGFRDRVTALHAAEEKGTAVSRAGERQGRAPFVLQSHPAGDARQSGIWILQSFHYAVAGILDL